MPTHCFFLNRRHRVPLTFRYHNNRLIRIGHGNRMTFRRSHRRHIIPHSDLQMIMTAVTRPELGNVYQLVRPQLSFLLTELGLPNWAIQWDHIYTQYHLQPNPHPSILQNNAHKITCRHIWRQLEWAPTNLFHGSGAMNEALQNRFDGNFFANNIRITRANAIPNVHPLVNALYNRWNIILTILDLNPTPLQVVDVYSLHLHRNVGVVCAASDNSRPVQPAIGRLMRSDYVH